MMILFTSFWNPVLISLQTAFTALLLIFILGTLLGRIMSRSRFPGKTIVETLFILPTVLPPTVIGFLLIIVLGANGWLGQVIDFFFQQSLMFTWSATVIVAVVVGFPFMYQSVKTGLAAVEPEIEEAARVSGASEWQVFFYISMPMIARSLVTGVILSFSRAIGEFGATFMFAGNIPGTTQTMPIAIFTALEAGDTTLAWAWVIVIVLLSFSLLFFVRKFSD
ncbi:molybdate transport system permease protein [Geomicrobium halophilum]|uniref:Molybdenum transport system permease n=1 Tax=Geomicrobium halophilum TaxID=549000 RepID=A0A841PMX5_9BACL|nr:molybdate ABC transporter permease subunit [Geomicrobium halophilum]MBB6450099.1 molybdate transport system permease protein [Geomicrobium halophilum]